MSESEIYKELGTLTKRKERWEESIPLRRISRYHQQPHYVEKKEKRHISVVS